MWLDLQRRSGTFYIRLAISAIFHVRFLFLRYIQHKNQFLITSKHVSSIAVSSNLLFVGHCLLEHEREFG